MATRKLNPNNNYVAEVFYFLSSSGLMVGGVALLFFCSLSFSPLPAKQTSQFLSFPVAPVRAGVGRDITVAPVVNLPASRPTMPLKKDQSQFNLPVTAVSLLVVDDKTNRVLYTKNADEVRSLASLSKLVSALVLLDLNLDWATTTKILAEDWDGASHHINVGEKFTAEDLWNVGLIGSSNTAINALVRVSGVSRERFVELMNEKVNKLGLAPMRFFDPTGLDSRNVGNARDVAKILSAALKQEKIASALKVGEYYAHPLDSKKQRRVWTTNWLLVNWSPNNFPKDDIAGKTGFINDSLYNFAVRLGDDAGHRVRVVVLGAASNEARFTEARDLAQWTFNHYVWPDEAGYDQLAE